jgi:hypothetical protein
MNEEGVATEESNDAGAAPGVFAGVEIEGADAVGLAPAADEAPAAAEPEPELLTVSQIVVKMGGTGIVAAMCGVSHGAVSQWRQNNRFPDSRRDFLAALFPQYFQQVAEFRDRQKIITKIKQLARLSERARRLKSEINA